MSLLQVSTLLRADRPAGVYILLSREHEPHVCPKGFSSFLRYRHQYGKLLLSNAHKALCFLCGYTTSSSHCACLANLPLYRPRVVHISCTALFFLLPQPKLDLLPILHFFFPHKSTHPLLVAFLQSNHFFQPYLLTPS